MFFKSYERLANKTVAEMDQIGYGTHKTLAAKDKLLDLNGEVAVPLNQKYNKADTLRGRAWALWTVAGIANFFIAAPVISGVLGIVTIAACATTCYQWLKCRQMDKALKRIKKAYEKNKDIIYDSNFEYEQALREEQRALAMAKKMAEAEAKKNQQPTLAEGFNITSSDVDLDKDITVNRPIRLKVQAPAAAA